MKLGASSTARPINAHRMLLKSNSVSAFLTLSFNWVFSGFMVQRCGMSLAEKPRLTVASGGMGGNGSLAALTAFCLISGAPLNSLQ